MRRICYGWIFATGLGAVFGGCSSDKKADFSGVGGSTAGSSAGGNAGASKGGSAGASTGGSAGSSDGGSAGSSDGGSAGDADGGTAGDANGGAGDANGGTAGAADGGSAGAGGASGGDAGSAGTAADGGAAGQGTGGCTVDPDDCPSGSYCTPENTCVPGCKDAAACASGVCGPTHDCGRCLADSECAEGRHCATGVCNAPCSESEPASCGGGRTCCGTRCVDITHDIGHCGVCGTACDPVEFCGTTGCLTAIVANVCSVARATALLDGQAADDAAAAAVLAGLEQGCAPAPTTQAVNQTLAEQINTQTGQVVTSGGELLVFAGGFFFQTAINYLEDARTTPVYAGGVFPEIGLYRTSDETAIITSTAEQSTDSHDIIVIQVGREPITGTPSLILYGFNAAGTAAAVWQFTNVMLGDLATYTDAYYVYEWTDGDADHLGDVGEFALIESGP